MKTQQTVKVANSNIGPDLFGIDFDLIKAQKIERLRRFKLAREEAEKEGRITKHKI